MSAGSAITVTPVPIIVGTTFNLSPIQGLSVAPTAAGLQFTFVRSIGVGEGRHYVFLGRDHQIDSDLVYKRIEKKGLSSYPAFFAEARRLYESRHRHVVPINYACEDTDQVFLAMPYFGHGSLQALLEKQFLTVREIVRLGLDFLMGLHHAHVQGVLHFDVKPSNIFLDDSSAAMLADFGQSRLVDAQGFAVAPGVYDLHMPPELNISSQLTRLADVYQAGLTLYRMCVGDENWSRQAERLPRGSSAFGDQVTKGKFPDRRAFPEHIPSRLKRLVNKAIEVDPDKRWPTVLDLMNELARVDGNGLDWQPSVEPSDGMVWERTKGHIRTRVELARDGGAWKVEVHRFGARNFRMNKDCRAGISEGVARDHVRTLLSTL